LKNLELPRASPEIILDKEIRALDKYLTPSAQEESRIEKLRAEVASLLEDVVPHAPRVIGSHCTGLVLAHSDLDFILPFEDLPRSPERDRKPSPTRPQIQDAHIRLLRQVERALQHTEAFSGQVYLSDKRNPALSARHRPTGLLLQFYCGEGIPAITEYLQDYQTENPSLRPLYTATRILLEARGLFGAPQASISPDALSMLIVAFLKMNHGRFPGANNLGDQLLALLHLYGTDVDLQTVGVSINPPGFFGADTPTSSGLEESAQRGQRSLMSAKRTAAAKGNTLVANHLCIQDPTHHMNDLGRSCTRTSELQGAFAASYEQLRRACDDWASNDENTPSILATALQAKFDGLEKLRGQIVNL
jgi:DNA polymerase sigma